MVRGNRFRGSCCRGALAGILFSTALSLTTAPVLAQDQSVVHGELGIRLDDYLGKLAGIGFSGAAVVARNGEVVLQKGYGYADYEQNRPVTPSTVFTIGSITKQFTGAAIMKLEMMGLLDVDDPITRFFDNVPQDKAGITLHHLLIHTAGLIDGLGGDFDLRATRNRVLKEAMESKLLWEPGRRHRYSNLGYSLLGMIVEKASGMGYEQFLHTYLFEPSGMTRTGYLLPDYGPGELAIGYQNSRRWRSVIDGPMLEDGPCWNLRANGGIHTTVGDIYRWHLTLEGDEVLSEAAKGRYFAPHVDEGGGDSFYGYGWVNWTTRRGTRMLSHNGGNGIFAADFRRYVEEDAVLFVVTNLSNFSPVDYVSEQIERIIFGEPYRMPPVTIEIEQAVLSLYTGTYRLATGSTIQVSVERGSLALTASGSDAVNLLAGESGKSSPPAEQMSAQSEDILNRAAKGDFTGFQEVIGEEVPLWEVEQSEGEWLKMREERYGEFRDLETVTTVTEGDRVHVNIKMNYERGSGFVRLTWTGSRLTGITLIREVAGVNATLFPVSPTEFESFSLRSPVRAKVKFETAGSGERATSMIFETEAGPIRATRADRG